MDTIENLELTQQRNEALSGFQIDTLMPTQKEIVQVIKVAQSQVEGIGQKGNPTIGLIRLLETTKGEEEARRLTKLWHGDVQNSALMNTCENILILEGKMTTDQMIEAALTDTDFMEDSKKGPRKAFFNFLMKRTRAMGFDPRNFGFNVSIDTDLIGQTMLARSTDMSEEDNLFVFAGNVLTRLTNEHSANIKAGNLTEEDLNRVGNVTLDIIDLVAKGAIVRPTREEVASLQDWLLQHKIEGSNQINILSTVCPDYPFQISEDKKAHFTGGACGDGIGLVGSSIAETAPVLLKIIADNMNIPVRWIVGFAGFEGNDENLERMGISHEEFMRRMQLSAAKMSAELNGIPVGILPDFEIHGMDVVEFRAIRDSLPKEPFEVERQGMEALGGAVDGRDWAVVLEVANRLNAMILDGASVQVGRHCYTKGREFISTNIPTPLFVITNYLGF